MLGRDGIAGLVCLALSLFGLALTRGLPGPTMVPVGPGFYPRIVLGLMAGLSAMLLVSDVLAGRRGTRVAVRKPDAPLNYRLVAVTFAIFAVYVALLPGLGFRIATFLFVALLQVVLDPARGWRRWLLVLAVAAVTSGLTFLAFDHYLSVLLPRGSWTGM